MASYPDSIVPVLLQALDRGTPAIVWDVMDAEWGLIIGYHLKVEECEVLGSQDERRVLPFSKLRRNGIDIISAAIPGGANRRSRGEIIRRSLTAAADHAEQRGWTDRPAYQNGLAGFDLWASCYEKWNKLQDRGGALWLMSRRRELNQLARYTADHAYSARYYAAGYLNSIADRGEPLHEAARH